MVSLLTFVLCSSLLQLSFAAYTLQDDYSGANFLKGFTFFTDTDPTAGYVDYVNGQSSGLFSQSGGSVKLSVDSSSVASGRGRKSVRVTSKASYNHALIIINVGHMPGNICGVWPAFWTTGPNWPSNGEIDILEGVNKQSTNKMTLHSDPGCSMNGKDCQGSTGCSIDAGPYGANINSAGGAVYALEWTSDGMRIWGWSGGGAPSDATGNSPNPSGWGRPTANFPSSSSCKVDTFFKNQQIVFDTTFCGVWAGDSWPTDPACSGLAATCQEYVQNNPTAFRDAYWTIKSLKVYTNGAGSTGSSSSTGNTGNTGSTGTQDTAPNPGPANPVQSTSVEANTQATTAPPVANPVSTARPVLGNNHWGGGGGGGRGGRGGPPNIKRRIKGRHMKHLIIETSDEVSDRGQSVILEEGMPALGEVLED
ncbi:MAG: hypothetical protein LQ338_000640 [Usnochroma carphineum]|nr:MAG: hypothetical protein LQ338_000640 [Usnochroma carphineum]